jgi:hypothetical protein
MPYNEVVEPKSSANPNYMQCINCEKLVHLKYNCRKRDSQGNWSIYGTRINVQKSVDIFINHRIMINEKCHVICFNCDKLNVESLNITTVNLQSCEKKISSYGRLLTHLAMRIEKMENILKKHKLNVNNDEKNETINNTLDSNKKVNKISFDLLTDHDCKTYCRLTKRNIMEIAKNYLLEPRNVYILYNML